MALKMRLSLPLSRPLFFSFSAHKLPRATYPCILKKMDRRSSTEQNTAILCIHYFYSRKHIHGVHLSNNIKQPTLYRCKCHTQNTIEHRKPKKKTKMFQLNDGILVFMLRIKELPCLHEGGFTFMCQTSVMWNCWNPFSLVFHFWCCLFHFVRILIDEMNIFDFIFFEEKMENRLNQFADTASETFYSWTLKLLFSIHD